MNRKTRFLTCLLALSSVIAMLPSSGFAMSVSSSEAMSVIGCDAASGFRPKPLKPIQNYEAYLQNFPPIIKDIEGVNLILMPVDNEEFSSIPAEIGKVISCHLEYDLQKIESFNSINIIEGSEVKSFAELSVDRVLNIFVRTTIWQGNERAGIHGYDAQAHVMLNFFRKDSHEIEDVFSNCSSQFLLNAKSDNIEQVSKVSVECMPRLLRRDLVSLNKVNPEFLKIIKQ